jgi:uncharacterized protein YdeI (YjbR/CyaY-like superfamily)
MQRHFMDRASWRAWLKRNHAKASELWMVFYKKHSGVATVSYEQAVEEALCFGWVDSLIRRLDEDRYARKFTPRKDGSKWSASNLRRVEKLKAAGMMTAAGLAKIPPNVSAQIGHAGTVLEIPPYFWAAIARDRSARRFFEELAPSYRREFVLWVDSAKREETRHRRLAEVVARLRNGEKPGLKSHGRLGHARAMPGPARRS